MREQRTHLNPEHPMYAEWKDLTDKLAWHRKEMHALWKRREGILAQKRAVNGSAMPAPAPAAPAGFNAVSAGAPRASVAPAAPAHHAHTIIEKVVEALRAHPGVVYTASTMATTIGLGVNLRAPVGEALRALAKKKVVTEVSRNKFAALVPAEAAQAIH
jgi:hypothetical protein